MIKKYKFTSYYKKLNIFSLILIFLAFLCLLIKGLNLGIDFKGGTLIETRIENTNVNISEVRQSLLKMQLGNINVKKFGKNNDYLLKIETTNINDT